MANTSQGNGAADMDASALETAGGTPAATREPTLDDALIDPARRIVSIRPTWPQRGLPPGPPLPAAIQQLAFWHRREAFFEQCRARYGHRFTLRLRLPSVPFVAVSHPDDVKAMFLAPPDVLYAGDGSAELEKYFGPTGLTFMEEEEHLKRRRIINRAAHGEAVKRLGPALADLVEREVGSWPRDEFVELHPWIYRLAVKAMQLVSFGPREDPRIGELLDVHIEMMRFGETLRSFALLHTMPPRVVRALKAIPPLGFGRFFELRERANGLIRDIVEDRRREGVDEDAYDLVSILLATTHEDGSPLHWIEVRDEIVTTFVAGSESTAATLAFGIERLAHDARVRERARAEVDAGDDDSYLSAIFHEILRLKPTVPIIPRQVMKPFEIGGYVLPPGVRMFAVPYLTHTDPSVYPDPYEFRPERFLESGPGVYTWFPFGGGRRRCLGKTIAEHEVKAVLRQVLSRYDLRPERPELERARPRTVVYIPGRGCRIALSERSSRPAGTAREPVHA